MYCQCLDRFDPKDNIRVLNITDVILYNTKGSIILFLAYTVFLKNEVITAYFKSF